MKNGATAPKCESSGEQSLLLPLTPEVCGVTTITTITFRKQLLLLCGGGRRCVVQERERK